MEDIYFCDSLTSLKDEEKIQNENITHIITTESMELLISKNYNIFFVDFNGESPENTAYRLCPRVSDFLREVLLLKGKLLLINN